MRALFFGSIGSIVETSELQRQAFNDAFAEHGLGWHWDQATYQGLLSLGGGDNRIASYAQSQGETVDARALHQTKTQRFQSLLTRGRLAIREGVVDTLNWAQEHGIKIGFISTTHPVTVRTIRETLAQRSEAKFDWVTDAENGFAQKPSSQCYDWAIQTSGENADDILVVEDNGPGIKAAKAAGLKVVAYPGENTRLADVDGADIITTATLLQDIQRYH